jgi:hypothetical protein
MALNLDLKLYSGKWVGYWNESVVTSLNKCHVGLLANNFNRSPNFACIPFPAFRPYKDSLCQQSNLLLSRAERDASKRHRLVTRLIVTADIAIYAGMPKF